MSYLHASTDGVRVAAVILLTALCAGCVRPLAVQHDFFSPTGGSAGRISAHAQHTVSHYRALQAARHTCASQAPALLHAGPGDENLHDGPNFRLTATHEALTHLCAEPARPPVAAYGATSNAYRRWVEDQVRELPEATETAAAAGGGS